MRAACCVGDMGDAHGGNGGVVAMGQGKKKKKKYFILFYFILFYFILFFDAIGYSCQ
jgi:hypothetical protein